VSELEPSFCERVPAKSVSGSRAEESELRSVPMVVSAVSWASRAVSWVFQGVSTVCRLAMIWLTVLLTSKPWPLVGEPNEMPTVLIISLSSCVR
jgi:hypothetical protein